MMDQQGIDTSEVFRRLVRGWGWIMALSVAGSLLGLVLAGSMALSYQASAVMGVGFDYGRTLPLDEEAMRYANERVREFLLSDEVLIQAVELAPEAFDMPQEISSVRLNLRLSQKESSWELIAIADDPEGAVAFANAWAGAAEKELREAARHAWRVKELQALASGIGCQLREDPTENGTAVWVCDTDTFGVHAEDVLPEILEEAELGRGILPGASFYISRQAGVPAQPTSHGRGTYILAGLLAGMVLGSAFVVVRPARVNGG
jgi:hypothetical protein